MNKDRQHFNTGAGGYFFRSGCDLRATEKLNKFSRNVILEYEYLSIHYKRVDEKVCKCT